MNQDQQHSFDADIRARLAGLEPDYQNGSWDLLAERLPGYTVNHESSDDEAVREKLNGLQPDFDQNSWLVLRERLDAIDDTVVADRLRNSEPAFRPSSWASLAARLELVARRRSAVAAYKFSELCLLLSMLLIFWTSFNTESRPVLAESFPILEQGTLANSNSEVLNQEVTTNKVDALEQPTGYQPNRTSDQLKVITPLPVDAPRQLALNQRPFRIKVQSVTRIDALDYQLESTRTSPQPPLFLKPKRKEAPLQFYLRAFVSPLDINQIITPAAKIGSSPIQIERDNRISYGRSIGFSIDIVKAKDATQLGLVYGFRSYIPTVLKKVEGFTSSRRLVEVPDTNYSRIAFKTLSIPLSYERELHNNGRWRLAASAGVGLQVNLEAKFSKGSNLDQALTDLLRPVPGLAQAREGANSISRDDFIYPEKGLLQGGSMLANSSLYFRLGFSIERQLNDHFSVYFAPNFTRTLYSREGSGAEPYDDRIHSNSFQLGTRYRLGKKD